MSNELDEVARAVFNGQIPAIWKMLAPDTLQSLGNWMCHYQRRFEQYSQWVREDSLSWNILLFFVLLLEMKPYIILETQTAHESVLCLHQVEDGEPKVMWLSGLHIPESYLTALVQAACRKNGWPLDLSTLYTQVTQFHSDEEITDKPDQGNDSLLDCDLNFPDWRFSQND